jgi:hypothetical protein
MAIRMPATHIQVKRSGKLAGVNGSVRTAIGPGV